LLILTRRVGERVFIGDEVVVSVEQVRGHQVRLGIAAPPQIAVHRREVLDRIQADAPNCSSLGTPRDD
jgi:carbon storage regulator